MKHLILWSFLLIAVFGAPDAFAAASVKAQQPAPPDEAPAAQNHAASLPVFRNPIVPGATISGYFDHNPADNIITFYNGRRNNSGAGFYFQCSSPRMYDWVGCEDPVKGEGSCSNARELWYDEHHGTDFEFSDAWHTGATCDPGRFAGLTMPIYAPARGRVLIAGYDPNRPGNGWHIRLQHDLNGNGNFNDDNFRSIYLHFTANALAVRPGQIVEEGQYLGLGGSTGYSSSPHLHFEVQRSSDNFSYTYWPVDPYGWTGPGADPWPYENVNLFRAVPVQYPNRVYLPQIAHIPSACAGCSDVLKNGGFESGREVWVEQGVQIVSRVGDRNLNVAPYEGSWLAWLGGRNSADDVLYQTFRFQQGVETATLTYQLYISTTETNGVYDRLYVRLRREDGSLLATLDTVDNTYNPAGTWTQRSLLAGGLAGWGAQNLRISFEAVTDDSNQSSFYVDNVNWEMNEP
jgi:hypothetical protein